MCRNIVMLPLNLLLGSSNLQFKDTQRQQQHLCNWRWICIWPTAQPRVLLGTLLEACGCLNYRIETT